MVPADEGGRLMRTDLLGDPIDGLDEALAAVDAFDDALVTGLLRPQPAQTDGLAALAAALGGTPLAALVAEAARRRCRTGRRRRAPRPARPGRRHRRPGHAARRR
ncbi:hypothetical protein ACWD5B_18415, partial [Streptomyces tanashiensis]